MANQKKLQEHQVTTSSNKEEPTPKQGKVDVWPLVVADMQERNEIGKVKYGTPLQTHNGRNGLVDAYQEALDLVVYLRQRIEENAIVFTDAERACLLKQAVRKRDERVREGKPTDVLESAITKLGGSK